MMIRLQTDTTRFTYRIVGVALHDGHVLLQTSDDVDFWFLPGGRAELMESGHDTLVREMQEELGVIVVVERLVWLVENFFFFNQKAGHELALYFLMTLPPEPVALYQKGTPFYRTDAGAMLTFQWYPLDQLQDIPIYPTFLKKALLDVPTQIVHVVHTDEESKAKLAELRGW